DLDDMLAPAEESHAGAQLPSSLRQIVRALTKLDGVELAIFSGHELADVRARVGLPEAIYVANHGLEISTPERSFVEPTAAELRGALRTLGRNLEQKLERINGV